VGEMEEPRCEEGERDLGGRLGTNMWMWAAVRAKATGSGGSLRAGAANLWAGDGLELGRLQV
jgi:hypothetical protein